MHITYGRTHTISRKYPYVISPNTYSTQNNTNTQKYKKGPREIACTTAKSYMYLFLNSYLLLRVLYVCTN